MEMVFHKEEDEISVVNEKPCDASDKDVALKSCAGDDSEVTVAVTDAKDVKKSSSGAAAVCLGLLCLLLLIVIGLKTLVSQLTRSNSEREMEMVHLHSSYNNLTISRDQLQTSYNNLINEGNQLENNLTRQNDQLQTSYNNLTIERDQLQTSYNNLISERNQLENHLTRQNDQLQTSYNNLINERNQLENNLTRQNDQLQTSYNQLATEKDQLQERFEALTKNRDDLQRKLQDTEASWKNLIKETADLKRILGDFEWVYFRGSVYYVSSIVKTWQQSRNDCLQKGADLMIINNKEEQNFSRQFKKYMWIGLTDSEKEGTWKWVDGTPLTKSYWGSEEPNGGKHENCGDIKYYDAENSWNDDSCSSTRHWICEKKVLP